MTCPVCNGDTQVTYTYDKDDHVVRDRKCRDCGYKFQTIEADEDMVTRFRQNQSDSKLKKFLPTFKEVVSVLEGVHD